MTTSTITKTLNKLNDENLEKTIGKCSLGFKRYAVLPNRVQKNIRMALLIQEGILNVHDKIVSFFESMTEKEYVNYLRLA